MYRPYILVAAITIAGALLVLLSSAATPTSSIEAENGIISGPAMATPNELASKKSAVRFGKATTAADAAANLAMILASPFRNTAEDSSPYSNTPSANLAKLDASGNLIETDLANKANRATYGEFGPGGLNEGRFRAECEFSHFSYDDPIVYPNQPGKAHLHMFFGNTHTNAFTDYNSLINSGGSTCNGHELNRTGYWVPAMYDAAGNVRVPDKIVVYYKTQDNGVGKIRTYPDNMRIVADSTINYLDGFGGETASFKCLNQYGGDKKKQSEVIPICNPATDITPGIGAYQIVEFNVKFNQCWNGQDPSNYAANFSRPPGFWYSNLCPAAFSTILPELEFRVFYRVNTGETTQGWYLSSDVDRATGAVNAPGGSTVHADWFGGWNKVINKIWVDKCNNIGGTDCYDGFLGGSNIADPYPALKRHVPYTPPASLNATNLFTAVCKSGKKIAKPSDTAYCVP